MNIFKRLKVLWVGFWESILQAGESQNHQVLIEGTIKEYQGRLKELQNALVNLHFHKKKLENKQLVISENIEDYEDYLERMVLERKDDKALKIIAKIDQLKEEKEFLMQQLKTLSHDIDQADSLKLELESKIGQSGEQIRVVGQRIKALQVRKDLQKQLDALRGSVDTWNPENGMERLRDHMQKLEIEVETVAKDPNGEEISLNSIRKDSVQRKHRERLDELKSSLLRKSLPEPKQVVLT